MFTIDTKIKYTEILTQSNYWMTIKRVKEYISDE